MAVTFAGVMFFYSCRKEGDSREKEVSAIDSVEILRDTLKSIIWPLRLCSDVTLDSVAVVECDSTLVCYMTFDDDLADSVLLSSDMTERNVILRTMALSSIALNVIEAGRKSGLNLYVEIATTTGTRSLKVNFPKHLYHGFVAVDSIAEHERAEIKVNARVRTDNRDCPYEIDDGVILTSMTVQDRYVTFHSEIDVGKIDFKLLKQNRDSLAQGVVLSLREQLADSLQRASLLDIARARMGYRNRYVRADGKDSFDISFTPTDLLKLIRASDSINSRR